MILRLGTNARRTGTGGHRVFAGNPQLARTALQRITGPSGTSLLS